MAAQASQRSVCLVAVGAIRLQLFQARAARGIHPSHRLSKQVVRCSIAGTKRVPSLELLPINENRLGQKLIFPHLTGHRKPFLFCVPCERSSASIHSLEEMPTKLLLSKPQQRNCCCKIAGIEIKTQTHNHKRRQHALSTFLEPKWLENHRPERSNCHVHFLLP